MKKLTCFDPLDASLPCLDYGIPLSQVPVSICKDVVFRGIQFEKCSYGRFRQ